MKENKKISLLQIIILFLTFVIIIYIQGFYWLGVLFLITFMIIYIWLYNQGIKFKGILWADWFMWLVLGINYILYKKPITIVILVFLIFGNKRIQERIFKKREEKLKKILKRDKR